MILDRDDEQDRRKFLKSCGRFAAVTPPAMTLLLSTSLTSTAIARSGSLSSGSGGGGTSDGRSFFDNEREPAASSGSLDQKSESKGPEQASKGPDQQSKGSDRTSKGSQQISQGSSQTASGSGQTQTSDQQPGNQASARSSLKAEIGGEGKAEANLDPADHVSINNGYTSSYYVKSGDLGDDDYERRKAKAWPNVR